MEPSLVVEGEGGVPIATWEMAPGDASAPTLLVAHATGFHTGCYRALVDGLEGRFRVVGFDTRAHGHSGTPPLRAEADGRVPAMDWRCFAADALAVVGALGLERPFAFGHSAGGALLLLAEQQRPGTFRAIYAYEPVVVAPEVWDRMDERGNPAEGARRRRSVFASRAAALEHLSSKQALAAIRSDVLVDYVDGGFTERPDGDVGLRCDPEAEAATYAMARHAGTWERLPEVACAVTVACGGSRADFGREAAAAVAGRLQQARVEVLADLGHFGPFEEPELVAQSVVLALLG